LKFLFTSGGKLSHLISRQTHFLEYSPKKLSPEVIHQSLKHVQGSIIKDNKNGKTYLLPSKADYHAKEIYRIFRIPIPRKMMAIKCNA
jgi:rRNA pseudouridine-1189 N-methylase Emg1 (Nep1/Mra1 family)